MDIEKRLTNLENLVESLIETINNSKFYTDADIAGVRICVSDLTPYTESKVAYYGETEKTFYNVPEGKMLVYFDGNIGSYSIERIENRVKVVFDAVRKETKITISIQ